MRHDTESLLEQVSGPADVRSLSTQQLPLLAAELREFLMRTVPKTGGHFASNLGNAELVVAIHHVYESPRDAIVWDVSHGAYPHKLLTGRREKFHRLRADGGPSGFLCPFESEHDLASTGHAGTGLSTALGIACARKHMGAPGDVVVVVGDGSFSAGMTQEALNHLSTLGVDLTIILNDNQMSIDPTHGGLAGVLSAARAGDRPDAHFEKLGLRYVGPIDGHDAPHLAEVLSELRALRGAKLLHVVTKKGKGCPEAEANPVAYHALSPPRPAAGVKPRSFSDAFAACLIELAAADSRIVAVGAGMLGGTGLAKFRSKFPDRCHDVGIAEQHAVTFAAGLAKQGMRPVVAIYSTFLQRAYDQILHDVCLPGLPVVFAIDRAGCVGPDGPTHHGMFDIAYMQHIPNMKITSPSSRPELSRHLRAALNDDGPVAVRYPRAAIPEADHGPEELEVFGRWRTLRRGDDVAVLALGSMVPVVLESAEILAARGVDVEVVEARSVKPLDEERLFDLGRRHAVVATVEDHAASCGLGSAVAGFLGMTDTRVAPIGWPDRFVEHGGLDGLRRKYRLDPEGVADRVAALLDTITANEGAGARERVEVQTTFSRRRLLDEISELGLSEVVRDAVAEYRRVGDRSDFLWQWVRRGLELTTLSCVDESLREEVCDTKTLGVMFDVLLDDVADVRRDAGFLDHLIGVTGVRARPVTELREDDRAYYDFVRSLWTQIWDRLRGYPRFGELEEILRYDYDQLMNVMRYSTLVNRHPFMLNPAEHDAYLPHNMHMMISATMDLMASPGFDIDELGRVRQVLTYAQQMGRIGNLVTTWERELEQHDFSSGVFAKALTAGVLSVDELRAGNRELIARRVREADLERSFLDRWSELRRRILKLGAGLVSIDVDTLVAGLDELIQIHLASRGHK